MLYTFIGDIHANKADLEVLLAKIGSYKSQVIFLGDYIDGNALQDTPNGKKRRSLDPIGVLDIVRDYVLNRRAIGLLGNHDDFLIQTANGNRNAWSTWLLNGGLDTWKTLGMKDESLGNVQKVLTEDPYLHYTQFLQSLPLFFETDHLLAVHAGIDWTAKLQRRHTLLWVRNAYYYKSGNSKLGWHHNDTGKVIITGHTPAQMLVTDKSIGYVKMQSNPEDVPRYDIDAGSSSGLITGGIFALTLDELGHEVYQDWCVRKTIYPGNKPLFF